MLIDYHGHKIFAFSDTHGVYRRLSIPAEANILICAGDACEGFNPADLKDFFDWYTSIPAQLRIFVPGNHDRIFNQESARARNLIPGGFFKALGNAVAERFGSCHFLAVRMIYFAPLNQQQYEQDDY